MALLLREGEKSVQVKKINIGGIETENNLFLAPLAGYTNYPFRKMCLSLGASLAFSEMVSCKGLKYDNENTTQLLYTGEEEKIKAAQIFGCDPQIMRSTCEGEHLELFDIIDINMGCPMPKIYNNGEGSALLNDIPLAEKIISECTKSGKIITVKMRIGIDENHIIAEDFAKACEGAGASMLSVHGRTKDKIYAGEVDYAAIAKVKNAVKIPVVANGGIFSPGDADRMMEETGADGVMLARGALYNPRLFCEILGRSKPAFLPLFLEELKETEEIYGEHFAVVFMRKMASFYVKGIRGAAEIKNSLFKCSSVKEIESIVKTLPWD